MTARQAAEFLGCSPQSVWVAVKAGRLTHRTGTWRTIGRSSVLELYAARGRGAPADGHDWIDTVETSRLLGITPTAVRKRLRAGHLPAVRGRDRWWLRRDHVEQIAAAAEFTRLRRTSDPQLSRLN